MSWLGVGLGFSLDHRKCTRSFIKTSAAQTKREVCTSCRLYDNGSNYRPETDVQCAFLKLRSAEYATIANSILYWHQFQKPRAITAPWEQTGSHDRRLGSACFSCCTSSRVSDKEMAYLSLYTDIFSDADVCHDIDIADERSLHTVAKVGLWVGATLIGSN